MTRTVIDGVHKIEIVEKENYSVVTMYELMGSRYVKMSQENYSKELANELF